MLANTQFSVASLTKTFTGAAMIKLQQDGKLSIADPLSKALPDFPNGDRITYDLLLRHAAGVGVFDTPDVYQSPHTIAELAAKVARLKPLFEPGKGDEYSNEGYVLLARAIEVVSGQAYADYLKTAFLAPLGMTDTALDAGPVGRRRARGARAMLDEAPLPLDMEESPIWGASGLRSCARDLHRWCRAVHDKTIVDLGKVRYPYGWGKRVYQGRKLIEQSGEVEGFGSYIAAYEDGHVVVCLSNIQSGMQGRWGPDFAAVLFGGAVSTPPRIKAVAGATDLAGCVGEYRNADVGTPFRLRLRDGRLESSWGAFPFWRPVSPVGPDEFFIVADYSRLVLRRDASGRVDALAMPPLEGSEPGPTFQKV
jgi:CubicO group peptidase (beta-lactamase class C family)